MKKLHNNKKILQKRLTDTVSYSDAAFYYTSGYTVAQNVNKNYTISFGKVHSKIYAHFRLGNNKDKMRVLEDVTSLYRSLNYNEDLNGPDPGSSGPYRSAGRNDIFLPDIENLEHIILTTSANGVNAMAGLWIDKKLPYLKTVDIASAGNNLYSGDLDFLRNAPNLKVFKLRITANSPLNLESLTSSSIEFLDFTQRYVSREMLPSSLKYAILKPNTGESNVIELSQYFSGKMLGLEIQPIIGSGLTVSYTGNAIFPSTISDQSDYPIAYILYTIAAVTKKLTGEQLSRFLVDFANQVTSVTTAQKRIRVVGGVPNTSYEDPSQPLFKTYASALAHITGTLGVTVQFT